MPSAPRAEGRRRWVRRAALAAAAMALVALTAHPICNWLFACGCSPVFAGGVATCNIHQPGPPDCPVCTNTLAGVAFTAALLAGWGGVVVLADRLVRRGR